MQTMKSGGIANNVAMSGMPGKKAWLVNFVELKRKKKMLEEIIVTSVFALIIIGLLVFIAVKSSEDHY